jgi:4-hydroxyphenylpyruvate dioxygenase
MKASGVAFQDTIDTYYDLVDRRLPGHGENLEALRKLRILIDGKSTETSRELLLQIFTTTVIGPIFFEIISVREIRALAKVTSAHCLNPLSSIRFVAVY